MESLRKNQTWILVNPPKAQKKVSCKLVLVYLRSYVDAGLMFRVGSCSVFDFVDSDFVGDLDKRRSTTNYVFCMYSCAIR